MHRSNKEVLAFMEVICYIQNLAIRQNEPVSEICAIPFSNFGNWITFGPLRIRCSPVATGGFGGFSPPKQSSKPPKLNHLTQ